MRFLKSSFIAALLVLLYACAGKTNQQSVKEEPMQPATTTLPTQTATKLLPSFAVIDANGHTQNLQQFKGKKLFVNLWATWCPPCRAEMPSIEKLYAAANKEEAQFVMLSLDDDFEKAKEYIQANDLTLPIYYPAGDLPELFVVNGIPTTFIFNEAGELVDKREGSENYDTPAYRELFGAAR